jgi:hypothetical protein
MVLKETHGTCTRTSSIDINPSERYGRMAIFRFILTVDRVLEFSEISSLVPISYRVDLKVFHFNHMHCEDHI